MASTEGDGRCEDSSELEDLEESFDGLKISGEYCFKFKFESCYGRWTNKVKHGEL